MPKEDKDPENQDDEGQDDKENIEAQIEEKDTKIEELEKQLAELQKSSKDKGENIVKIRKLKEEAENEKEAAEKEVGKLREELDDKISKVRDEFASDKLWSEINKRAGGNEKLAEKIKHYYDNFKGEPESEEEKNERLDNAEVLATGSGKKGLSAETARSGVGKAVVDKKPPKVKPEVEDMGKDHFNLTDEDFGEEND